MGPYLTLVTRQSLASLSAFRLPKCDVVRLTVLTAHLGSLP